MQHDAKQVIPLMPWWAGGLGIVLAAPLGALCLWLAAKLPGPGGAR